jgi:hypothetical protein
MPLDVLSGRPSGRNGTPPGTSTRNATAWNTGVEHGRAGGTFLGGSFISCAFTLPDVRIRGEHGCIFDYSRAGLFQSPGWFQSKVVLIQHLS